MFKVGQKVVCIKATQSGSVKEGEIYTVKAVGFNYEYWVQLEETKPSWGHVNFSAWRFRKVETEWVDELLCKLIEEVEAGELVSA